MLNKRKRNLFITTIVFLSIILDQISKIWVRNNFESYIENSIIGDVFTLINVERFLWATNLIPFWLILYLIILFIL